MLFRTPIAVAALALAACSAQNARPPPAEPVGTTMVTRAALSTETPRARRDSRAWSMTTPVPVTPAGPTDPKIRAALANDPALAGVAWEHLAIENRDGHVILRGYMWNAADSVQVELTVRRIKGIQSVENRIRVLR